MGQDAALAVEDVAGVTLAALHTVVVAVALEADGRAAWLADAHAALIMAVGRTGDGWKRRRMSGLARSQGLYSRFPSGHRLPTRGGRGLTGSEFCHPVLTMTPSASEKPSSDSLLLTSHTTEQMRLLEFPHRIFVSCLALFFEVHWNLLF